MHNDKAVFALRAALWELDRLVQRGMSPQEFDATRAFLLNYSKLWVQTLSRRLGYAIDGEFYGKKDLVYSGPLYKSMKVEGDKVRLSFAHTAGGLKSRDGKPLTEFEVAGEDGKFVPAEAAVEGETVVVHAKGVASPAQVRFGWRNVANPNLANKAGLPASPFQTKEWQGGTGE